MWVCNCKSDKELYFHETHVFDGGRCYYCGYYAIQGRPNIPANDYKNYMKSKWTNGPFKLVEDGRKKNRPKHRENAMKKLHTYLQLLSKGLNQDQIADSMGISKRSLRRLIYTNKDKINDIKARTK